MLLPFIPRAFIVSIVQKDELAYAELCDVLGYSVTENRNAVSLLIEYNETYKDEYVREETRQKKEQRTEAMKRISNRDRQELLRDAFETIAAVMSATEEE